MQNDVHVAQHLPPVPAGWHPDPWGAASWRWWDGNGWSGRTAPADPGAPFLPLRDLAGQLLEMDPKSAQRAKVDLTIARGAEPAGRIVGNSVGVTRTQVELHCAEGSWMVVGRPTHEWDLQILSLPAGHPIATVDRDPSGTPGDLVLTFADGRRFLWTGERGREPEPTVAKVRGLLKTAAGYMETGSYNWEMVGPDGASPYVARLMPRGGMNLPGRSDSDCVVELREHAAHRPEMPLLTMFAFFMAHRVWAGRQYHRHNNDGLLD